MQEKIQKRKIKMKSLEATTRKTEEETDTGNKETDRKELRKKLENYQTMGNSRK